MSVLTTSSRRPSLNALLTVASITSAVARLTSVSISTTNRSLTMAKDATSRLYWNTTTRPSQPPFGTIRMSALIGLVPWSIIAARRPQRLGGAAAPPGHESSLRQAAHELHGEPQAPG